ncbi:hypothetical protein HALLA_17640 [Halostagnicola larsenii XH-48]|uniref:Uncharacterized protein n=1 Tax=Halostagnicola larsenii XH-48 TaxID=797299 RepID=W0JV41_9EURY|nr:hypothetical protein [Halostagnicola larsenii]AHG01135.1 hypothetical protein HALLA_17640 [Halostagnicola larsenii XH-48]
MSNSHTATATDIDERVVDAAGNPPEMDSSAEDDTAFVDSNSSVREQLLSKSVSRERTDSNRASTARRRTTREKSTNVQHDET